MAVFFEKIIITLVLGFSVTVLLGLVMLQGTDFAIKSSDISEGMTFSLGDDTRAAAYAVIALMGGLGVSGIELLVYPYWIREKGYAEFLGDPNSPGWSDRARGWIRIIKIDAAAATILATVITAAFFLLGCAILHRQGIEPEGIGVVDKMSAIFTGTYGNWSRGLFLAGAFCTLFSTLLHATAANASIHKPLSSDCPSPVPADRDDNLHLCAQPTGTTGSAQPIFDRLGGNTHRDHCHFVPCFSDRSSRAHE